MPGINEFPARLAVALCELANPHHPGLPGILQAMHSSGQSEEQQSATTNFTAEFTSGIAAIKAYQELEFTIQGCPGSLPVRTHATFHSKQTESGTVILRPNGKSLSVRSSLLHQLT